ncbi:hypothetical protein CJF30_00007137 [Rutstroemia sp. NJR-2017a BBW]|nr:hypothetical protein CJF30_00007137 [Rutstroemia sp. NJR-2017a BBW]
MPEPCVTTHNACATIALLNIVMNIPQVDLGENLKQFKEETLHLKPAYRGRKLDQNNHIRALHNSFVRRMDILNADLSLSNDIEAKKKRRDKGKRPAKNRSKQNEDTSFHFIAFVPHPSIQLILADSIEATMKATGSRLREQTSTGT